MTQPTYFHYVEGERLPLELVDDTLAVGFGEPISQRRLAELRASDRRIDIVGRSLPLLQRNILVYRVGAVARGEAGLRAFAGRLLASQRVRFVYFVFRDPQTGMAMVPTDELIVRFRPEIDPERVAAICAELGLAAIERNEYVPRQYLLRAGGATPTATLDAANALQVRAEVEWAAPNFLRELDLAFQDRQWHLHNAGFQGGLAGEDSRVRGPAGGPPQRAWAITRGDPAVVVAVIDGGVDLGHPGINLAPGGRDFSDAAPDADPSPEGGDSHGTSCAGVVAGRGGLIDGAAPDCRVLPVKIFRPAHAGETNAQVVAAMEHAIFEAIHFGAANARVLSNSWLFFNTQPARAAVRDVIDGRGTIVVFSAGNQNMLTIPGAQTVPGVILVGSANNIGGRSGYSNFGPPAPDISSGRQYLSVLASSDGTSANAALWQAGIAAYAASSLYGGGVGPFEHDGSTAQIYTTDIVGPTGANIPPGPAGPNPAADPANTPTPQPDYTGTFGGTSSACPLVAGICALMVSANRDLAPAEVRYILEATADKIGTAQPRRDCPPATAIPAGKTADYSPATGYDGFTHTDGRRYSRYGFGRVNAEQAVRGALNQPIRQFVPSLGAYQDAIPVTLRRVPGTNQFVSPEELELIDARRDAELPPPVGALLFVRGAPGGAIGASFQPSGGAPVISDAISVQGEIR